MRWSRPYYTVQLTAYGCAHEVRVNDAPLYEDCEGNPGTVELPANACMRDGQNVVALEIAPMPGAAVFEEGAQVEAVVYVRSIDQDRERREEIARLSHVPAP